MKTLVVSIFLTLAFFTNFANAANGNKNEALKFAYNYEMNGNRIMSETIFKVEDQKYLHQHLKYNYAYDNQGRIIQKETLKWSEVTENYEKQFCLNFSYTDKEVNIELASWNNSKKAYSNIREKVVYKISDMDATVNYLSYKWNEKENNWDLVIQHSTTNANGILLADKTTINS